MRSRYSVAILGAGPSGAMCARELSRRGHSVVLLDRGRSSRPRPLECSSPSLARILAERQLGEIPNAARRPQNTFRSFWGSSSPDTRDFLFWQASPGVVLDRNAFDGWLRLSAREAGAHLIEPCKIRRVEERGKSWEIALSRDGVPQEFATRFLVDATGRTSRSSHAPVGGRHVVDKLVCLFSEFPLRQRAPFDAAVESAPDGWWYAACSSDRCQVAYFTDADLVGSPRVLANDFRTRLSATDHMCQFTEELASRPLRVTDARSSIRKLVWRGRWLAVGDAAWTLDPLSGNGVERALAGAQRAAWAISRALESDALDELERFSLDTVTAFQRALAQRQGYYAVEARWHDRPFWRRRWCAPLSDPAGTVDPRPTSALYSPCELVG